METKFRFWLYFIGLQLVPALVVVSTITTPQRTTWNEFLHLWIFFGFPQLLTASFALAKSLRDSSLLASLLLLDLALIGFSWRASTRPEPASAGDPWLAYLPFGLISFLVCGLLPSAVSYLWRRASRLGA